MPVLKSLLDNSYNMIFAVHIVHNYTLIVLSKWILINQTYGMISR